MISIYLFIYLFQFLPWPSRFTIHNATKFRKCHGTFLLFFFYLGGGVTFTFVTCLSAWQNFVVAVGAEGWFHLFDISAAAAKSDSLSQQDGSIGDEQKPSYTQHIPANTKVMIISDIGEEVVYDTLKNV